MKITAKHLPVLAFFVALLGNAALFAQDTPAHSNASQPVRLIELDNLIINPVSSKFILDNIEKAEVRGEILVIQLDTPGGLLESTRQIVKRMMNSEAPIVVHVGPSGSRAGSAGVFITLAAHIAAMAPSTNIGAAHPVNLDGGETDRGGFWESWKERLSPPKQDSDTRQETDTDSGAEQTPAAEEPPHSPMTDKILNDTVAWVRGIATARNRNADWAELAVTESVSITAPEALELKVIDLIADNPEQLLQKIHGRSVQTALGEIQLHTQTSSIQRVELSPSERLLYVIGNPNIAYILMMLGFYGLLFEVTHPGIGFPGIAGAICLILALFSFQSLPISFAGAALIILALLLFVAEAMVVSFGLLTLGGIVCLVLGSTMLIDSPEQWLNISISLILSFAFGTAAITVFLISLVLRSARRRPVSGTEGLIGETGVAETALNPSGKVFVHGEYWNAQSAKPVAAGDKIRVLRMERLELTVEPYTEEGGHS
ncbi:MAG: nodulation protein NfeD [Candidatus Omnitrophica bacterium]|nr:nodulation protein NfeD [Candidatus Omnitrophota bacterium]